MSCCGCSSGSSGKLVVLGLAAGAAATVGVLAGVRHREGTVPAHQSAPVGAAGDTQLPDRPDFVLGFAVNRIDGTAQDLNEYKGKVVMIVNTASKCGLTPQYASLEKLYQDKKERGFVILGFPANDFREQEPGSNQDIAKFCAENYGVSFPMFEKVTVTGSDQHPLYKKLAGQPEPLGGEPKWNFTKFLVDRSGRVVSRFEPRTTPDDPAVVAKVDELLAAK